MPKRFNILASISKKLPPLDVYRRCSGRGVCMNRGMLLFAQLAQEVPKFGSLRQQAASQHTQRVDLIGLQVKRCRHRIESLSIGWILA